MTTNDMFGVLLNHFVADIHRQGLKIISENKDALDQVKI